MKHCSIPGPEFETADAALAETITPGCAVDVASAFVTRSGAERLMELCRGDATVRVAARAAEVTDPDALLWLRDQGVEVAVAIGRGARRFHPKLYLVDDPQRGTLTVLSGSGNLTRGGLSSNTEQFELIEYPSAAEAAEIQRDRLTSLLAETHGLADVYGEAIWREWLDARKFAAQNAGLKEAATRWDRLNSREVKLGREVDRALLLSDLFDLYHRTVAAKLPKADGKPYVPTRFLQSLRRVEASPGNPVGLVRSICSRQTAGFDVILQSGDVSLTVESLVLDEAKPYHDLFCERTRELSRERVKQFG